MNYNGNRTMPALWKCSKCGARVCGRRCQKCGSRNPTFIGELNSHDWKKMLDDEADDRTSPRIPAAPPDDAEQPVSDMIAEGNPDFPLRGDL